MQMDTEREVQTEYKARKFVIKKSSRRPTCLVFLKVWTKVRGRESGVYGVLIYQMVDGKGVDMMYHTYSVGDLPLIYQPKDLPFTVTPCTRRSTSCGGVVWALLARA
jgi:hypothetical protein